jgi:tetratricopeptide (TPR) repeat protein
LNQDIFDQHFQKARFFHDKQEYEKSNEYLIDLSVLCADSIVDALLAFNYLKLQQLEKALDVALLSLEKEPHWFLYFVLGEIYIEKKDIYKSIKYYQMALEINTDDVSIYNAIARCYGVLNDYKIQKHYFLKSLSLDNKQIEVIKRLAFIEGMNSNYNKSIKYYKYILSLQDNKSIYHLLALAYVNINEYQKAMYYFIHSLQSFAREDVNIANICYYNLGICFSRLGVYEDAKKSYLHLLAIQPYNAKANWALSTIYLLEGNFKDGWKKYEWRKKLKNFSSRTHGLLENVPSYNGENLDNKILSVHTEQGFGDTIQFSRFIIYLLNYTNVKQIIFRTHTALYSLFEKFNNDRCRVYPEGFKYVEHIKADYQVALMSIPLFIDFDINKVYKQPLLNIAKNFSISLDNNKLNIGIAWAGNNQNKNNSLRSVSLNMFDKIIKNNDIQLYSLHLSDNNEDIIRYGYKDKIIDLSSKIDDFEDTAHIMRQLDIIISVDTVIVHLAGTLGLKTFLLLQYAPDFRWLLNTENSPWYNNIKILRQEEINNYKTPIERLELEIESILDFREEKLL